VPSTSNLITTIRGERSWIHVIPEDRRCWRPYTLTNFMGHGAQLGWSCDLALHVRNVVTEDRAFMGRDSHLRSSRELASDARNARATRTRAAG
jgi:hypothetical protein